jgi:Leucine-rich repeat (LRR) protein
MRFLIAFTFLVSYSFTVWSQCPGEGVVCNATERQALFDFRNAMNGNSWSPSSYRWTDAAINAFPATTLWGVTITNGDVTSIKIEQDISAIGTLPTTIGNLTELQELTVNSYSQLPRNRVQGVFPTSLNNLKKLVTLSFSRNELTALPTLGNGPGIANSLVLLQNLNLSNYNTLTQLLPDNWQHLTALRQLSIDNVRINGVLPTWIGNFTQLNNLSCSACGITGLPSQFGSLTSLINFYAGANFITSLPSTFSQLTNLKILNLYSNGITASHLSAMVPILQGNTSLEDLSLANNNIGPALPSNFGSLTQLKYLYLNYNALTSSGNALTPLASLTNLIRLYLPNNLISDLPGSFPLINLTLLDLNFNSLPVIPASIDQLISIQFLYLSSNAITSIPNFLGNRTTLKYLYLGNNQISLIPTSFQTLVNLEILEMHNNQIQSIPPFFSGFNRISQLRINNNQITGSLPSFATWFSFREFYASNNQISGPFPAVHPSVLIGMRRLEIENNLFSSLPSFINASNPFFISLRVGNNRIPFGSIEHNLSGVSSHPFATFTYTTQNPLFGTAQTITLIEGVTGSLPMDELGGVQTRYQWQKYNGSAWVTFGALQTTAPLQFSVAASTHQGQYRCIATNSWIPTMTFTSPIITLVVMPPLCSTGVPAVSGSFKMDKLTGAIVFTRNDCPSPLSYACIYGPSLALPKVVASQATTFSDNWNYSGHYASNSTVPFPATANDFERGHRGKWRPSASYSLNTNVSTYDKTFNSGTYTYRPFDWFSPNTWKPVQWVKASQVTKYSPHGDPLEESNVLNIKSTVKFGYRDAVPYLTAQNAASDEVFFESFENEYSNDNFEDGYTFSGVPVTSTKHSGKFSMPLTTAAPVTLKQFPIRGSMQLKFWISIADWTHYNTLPSDLSIQVRNQAEVVVSNTPVTVVARTGSWVLCEALISSFGSGNTSFRPVITYSRAIGAWVDDVRLQPLGSEMTAYVYDKQNLKLLAVFDDQHFGLYYQYSAEGKLVRKLIETTQGVKTIQETQYNTKLR